MEVYARFHLAASSVASGNWTAAIANITNTAAAGAEEEAQFVLQGAEAEKILSRIMGAQMRRAAQIAAVERFVEAEAEAFDADLADSSSPPPAERRSATTVEKPQPGDHILNRAVRLGGGANRDLLSVDKISAEDVSRYSSLVSALGSYQVRTFFALLLLALRAD